MQVERVTIIGVGLIGGSLALDLKERGLAGEIVGVGRTRENLEVALARGVIDRIEADPSRGVEGADLVVLATPVGAIVPAVKQVIPGLKEAAVLTDVGSVKAPVVTDAEKIIPPTVSFVGGHPLTGSEQGGAGAARTGLFAGERVVITPTGKTDPEAVRRVRELWEEVGARVFSLKPAEHDRILAAVSHLPHVVSAAVVQAVFRLLSREEVRSTGAGSFRDLSRVSSSPPELWRDILTLNRDQVLEAVKAFRAALKELEQYLREGERERMLEFFQTAKEERDALVKSTR